MPLYFNNRKMERFIEEIRNLEKKIRNLELKKSEIVMLGLKTYFINLISEIKQNYNENFEEFVNDKELLSEFVCKKNQ